MNKFLERALTSALNSSKKGIGGPFGACITKVIDGEEKIVAVATNSVLAECDPTAHAEVNAIRFAGQMLRTHDLRGCTLYTTCYPCPMCMSAAIWANIDKIVYGCTQKDADEVGFRDENMYKMLTRLDTDPPIPLVQEDRDLCMTLFDEYRGKGEIY